MSGKAIIVIAQLLESEARKLSQLEEKARHRYEADRTRVRDEELTLVMSNPETVRGCHDLRSYNAWKSAEERLKEMSSVQREFIYKNWN